jgi:hypothetical protein
MFAHPQGSKEAQLFRIPSYTPGKGTWQDLPGRKSGFTQLIAIHDHLVQTSSDEILPKETAHDTPQRGRTRHASKRKSETAHAKP